MTAETPGDLLHWAAHRERPGIAITLDSEHDQGVLECLVRLESKPFVVVMLSTPALERIRDTWSLGAKSVVDRRCAPEVIVQALMLAADGYAVLPTVTVESIAQRLPDRANYELTPDQRAWLEGLVRGDTIAKLARDTGYSTREMHRELARFYNDLGVEGRTGAIAVAGRYGIR